MIRAFLGAVSFLTVLHVPHKGMAPGRSAMFFPLVGAILGAAGAALFLGLGAILPSSLASLGVVAFWAGISGVLHEDGLADVADAMRAGRPRDRMLAILKDSRIGTFGAVVLVLSVIARWQAVEHLATSHVLEVFIASQAVPRGAIVAMAWISRPAGTGQGLAFASTLNTKTAMFAIVQALAAAFACGIRPGLVIVLGSYLVVRIAQMYFYKRIGGINGDCLGATEQILEILILVLFTCQSCSW